MTITARAREITRQTDTLVEQTVRFFKDGTFIKDAAIIYAPGTDAASAQVNMASAVRTALASRAADAVTVAVVPGVMLDLTDPTPTPPTQAQLDQAAYFDGRRKVGTLLELQRLGRSEITQQMIDTARASWNALPYLPSYEGLI